MKPRIDGTQFGSITLEGIVYAHDVIVCPRRDGQEAKKEALKGNLRDIAHNLPR